MRRRRQRYLGNFGASAYSHIVGLKYYSEEANQAASDFMVAASDNNCLEMLKMLISLYRIHTAIDCQTQSIDFSDDINDEDKENILREAKTNLKNLIEFINGCVSTYINSCTRQSGRSERKYMDINSLDGCGRKRR